MPENWQTGGFGLYVHWPFCDSKCPYCDFNSHVVQAVDQARWADALCAEIRRFAAETPGRILGSIFFGGGTPSLMAVATVDRVITTARESWAFSNDIEITLEANPSSVEANRFAGYAQAGVNRLSIGVQSLRDGALRRLGRRHSADDARHAVTLAKSIFRRVSLDLIYARQDQTVGQWHDELTDALSMELSHYALYQLTIEQGTVFGARHARGQMRGLPDEKRAVDLWDMTQKVCENAGLPSYEVSNHARHGEASRHNLTYWSGGDWVGVGPGAHGRLSVASGRVATEALSAPGAWLNAVETKGAGDVDRSILSKDAQDEEYLIMGLRTSEGIDLERVSGQMAEYVVQRASALESEELVTLNGSTLRVTPAGRLLLNSVISALCS